MSTRSGLIDRTHPAPVTLEPAPSGGSHLVSKVVTWLVDQIRDGHLKPGDQLPSERQLCEHFSISRPVVREAMSHLRSDGLINVQHGRGAFVTEGRQRQVFRLSPVALTEKGAQAHVLELLLAIEVTATRLAAARRTDEDLRKIRRALVGMEYAILNDELGDAEDFAFHQAIVDATYNPHFAELSEHLEHSVRRLIRQARSHTSDLSGDVVKAVQAEHKAIYDAVEAGDPDAAALAAETHLRNAAARLEAYLDAADVKDRARKKAKGAANRAAAKATR